MSEQSVPMIWRRIRHRYNLVGRHCRTCDSKYFPPIPLCRKCRRKSDLVDFQFSGLGKIYSYTIIRDAPKGFRDLSPYAIAMVRLDEGPLVLSQIVDTDIEKLKIGLSVHVVFRRIGDAGRTGILRYSYKFKPLPKYATGYVIGTVDGEEGVQHIQVPMESRGRTSVRRTIEEAGKVVRRRKAKEPTEEKTNG